MTMEAVQETIPMADRIRRSSGRLARNSIASAKVTKDEQQELNLAAKREGKALSEWAREVLLERARKGKAEGAVFTELMALRLLLNGALREIALGRQMTEIQYQGLLIDVKKSKRQTAADVLAQYQPCPEGGE